MKGVLSTVKLRLHMDNAKPHIPKISVEKMNELHIERLPQKEDMFNVLYIKDFDYEFLHTLILFDDINNSKLFSIEKSFVRQQLRRCRHTNISYFLLIQGWKRIKPNTKNEISAFFIFSCFNKQQLLFIYSQSASNLDFEEFYNLYRQLTYFKNNNQSSRF